MTKSGRYCINDGQELEKVSGEARWTCHTCGAVWSFKHSQDGRVESIEVIFGGTK